MRTQRLDERDLAVPWHGSFFEATPQLTLFNLFIGIETKKNWET